jgi:hypothetical protein
MGECIADRAGLLLTWIKNSVLVHLYRRINMKNNPAFVIVSVLLVLGCTDGISVVVGTGPDGGQGGAIEDADNPGYQGDGLADLCRRTPVTIVEGCQTEDRMAVPFNGIDPAKLTIYLDATWIPPTIWYLEDGGNTLVLKHCFDSELMLSFSLDCRSTEDDCHLTAAGCP